ncbi:hypothetical protein N5J76_20750, partial [Pseudomonas sp. GD03855]|nr:hypothetical protein [Pseudomonas sp. GD03856]MDH2267333.1 hypothetical protein [Pseudomonas sp. GD03855]
PIGGLFIASLIHPKVRVFDRSSDYIDLFSGSDLFDLLGELLHERFPRLRSGVALDSAKYRCRGNSLLLSRR